MSDNFVTNPAAGGVTFASKDVGGTHVPYSLDVDIDSTGVMVARENLDHAILEALVRLVDGMPRLDGQNRRMAVVVETAVQVGGTLTSAGTVSTVGVLATLGTRAQMADAMPMHASNAGSMHIYNGLVFS